MNLLNMLQSQFSSQTVNQISSAVGESPGATKSALGTAFPALLGSLVGKATGSPGGASEVYNLVKPGPGASGWPDSVAGLLGSLSGGGAPAGGGSLLNSLLGSKLGGVTQYLSEHCGIKSSSAGSLLGMAAPLLMGTLGRQVASQGLGAAGLGELLGSQTQYLKDALPSGLANILGIGNLLRGGAEPSQFEGVGRPEAEVAAGSYGGRLGHEPVVPTQARHREGILKWVWVPVLLALLGWLIARRANRPPPAVGGTANYPGAVQSGGGSSTPNLQRLNLTPGGVADNFAKAASSGNLNQPFSLSPQSVNNAGNLTDSGRQQVQELGSVLDAMPNLKVNVTGYGDSQDAGLNQANAIKGALSAAGVAEERVTTSGQVGNQALTVRAQP